MNYRALSLILFVGMISCSKDKSADAPQAGIKVTGTFKDVNTLRVVPAELYSSRGKINDVVKTMEFVYSRGIITSFRVDGTTQILQDMEQSLQINEDNTIKMSYLYQRALKKF